MLDENNCVSHLHPLSMDVCGRTMAKDGKSVSFLLFLSARATEKTISLYELGKIV